MAEAIGSLFVALGLDSAAFSAGMKRVQSQAAQFAGNLGKAMGAIVAAAAPAMAAMGVAAADAAAEIQRSAQLANAAPSEFQSWAAGAKSVGIEQDKLADILKDVNDRVGDFIATGGGPMVDFFERIAPKVGVTADQFRNLSGPQALQLYISSLEKANVNQQDFTFFLEAMASDSTALLPLLRNGGKAMAEYAAKASALGVVMDDKTVAAFANAKRAFADTQMAMTGFRNIIAAQVLPVMSAFARGFVEASKEGNWLGDLVRGLAAAIPRLTAYITTFVALMGAKWVAAFVAARIATINLAVSLGVLRGALIRTGIGAVVVVAGELVYRFTDLVRASGGFSGALVALAAVAVEVWQRIGNGVSYVTNSVAAMASEIDAYFIGALNRMAGGWVEFTWSIADGMNALFGTNLQGASAQITQELARSRIAAEDTAAAYRGAAAAAAEAFGSPLKSIAGINSQIAESAEAAADGLQNMGDGLDAASDSGGGGKSKTKKLKEELTELQKAAEEFRDTLKGAFTGLVTGANSFRDALANVAMKLAEMLASSAFDKIFGATGGSGWISGALGWLGIGSNANGTNNWRGGLTRVNERGGEIMNLPRGTQIIPHDVSNRMADAAASRAAGGHFLVGFDRSTGDLTAAMYDAAGQLVERQRMGIIRDSVGAVSRASRKSKSFFG